MKDKQDVSTQQTSLNTNCLLVRFSESPSLRLFSTKCFSRMIPHNPHGIKKIVLKKINPVNHKNLKIGHAGFTCLCFFYCWMEGHYCDRGLDMHVFLITIKFCQL